MKKAIALLFCILTLNGCSSIESGFITKKVYTAPYDSVHFQCGSTNAQGICVVQIPITTHHAASYRFDLKQNDKTGWVYVNQTDYDRHQVGDCWSC